jgi:hypothetical protein
MQSNAMHLLGIRGFVLFFFIYYVLYNRIINI